MNALKGIYLFRRKAKVLIIIFRLYNMLKQKQVKVHKKGFVLNFVKIRTSALPFYPNDIFSAFWNLLLVHMLILTAILVPIRICFIQESETWDAIDICFDIFFGLDIIVNFLSAFYDQKNKLVTEWKQIILNYIQGWFILDFIAVFPFSILLKIQGGNYNKLIRLFRLARLYRVTKLIKLSKGRNNFISQIFEIFSMSPASRKLINIVIIMISMTHFVSCLWYYTSKLQFNDDSWVVMNNIED